jgi:penicillin-binding protein 1A
MKRAIEAAMGHAASGLRRAGGAIRRHPWRAVLALPLRAVLYVAALYPFTPGIGDIRKSKQESPTIVLSADGKELAVFKRANRDWVKLSDISPKAVEALLSTEDRRFYDHHGIDFIRTGKAVLNTVMGDTEGGSTITQQLARNLYPEEIGREQTVTRKIKEAITALKIEAIYSKDEILETYLNSVSFLYNAWGIEMAARTYFDKPAKQLNELEAATLIGMLKGTSYYNPVINPERALQRRNTVLQMMVEVGKLPQDRYAQLKAQPLKLNFERLPEFNGVAPHLTEYLRRWLMEWAEGRDYNIYADGLVVRTTIDSRLQAMANQAVERQGKALQAVADVEWSRSTVSSYGTDPSAYIAAAAKVQPFEYFWSTHRDLLKGFIRDSSEYKQAREAGKTDEQALEELQSNGAFMADLRRQKTMLQAGFMALEPSTGHVKAWVGSRDYREDKFDHVQQARRQPGSTFKPFVYGAAFEMGIPASETLTDAPVAIQIDKGQVWRPTDVGAGPTGQPMQLREGLARSKNTITAQLMMRVGPSRVASLARAMGVRQSKLQEVPSLALGTSPVTLKEMVTAFGTIANGGEYIEPQVVAAVEDRNGAVLESFAGRPREAAMSNTAAQTLLDALRGTIEYGTAVGLKSRFGLNGDLAGKTGTTQDNTDGWFMLMHPQLVTGAWVGFNDNRVAMRSEYWGQGGHNALLMVGDFMQQSLKAGVLDAKAVFAAPRHKDLEQPLMQRMGDWWNSVFSAPAASPEVAATQEVKLPDVSTAPPSLEPPPSTLSSSATLGMSSSPISGMGAPAVSPNAPVIADTQRVPSFPRPLEATRPVEATRPLEATRPVESVQGTQVYRTPDFAARTSEPARVATPTTGGTPAGGSALGAGGFGASGSTGSSGGTPANRPTTITVSPRSDTTPSSGFSRSEPATPATGSNSGASSTSSPAQPIGEASGSPSAPSE